MGNSRGRVLSSFAIVFLGTACLGEVSPPDRMPPGNTPRADAATDRRGATDAGAPPMHDAATAVIDEPDASAIMPVEPPQPRVGSLLWLVDGESEELVDYESSRYDSGIIHCSRPSMVPSRDNPAHTGLASISVSISASVLGRCDLGVFLRNHRKVRIEEGAIAWYGFAFMIPDSWSTPNARYMIANFHPISGGERFRIALTEDFRLELFSSRVSAIPTEDLGPVAKGRWHEIVVRTVYSASSAGRIELWLRVRGEADFRQLVDYAGQTVDDASTFPYHFRFGLMTDRRSSEWIDPAAEERTMYFDEIRVGDDASSFDEVAPASNVQLDPDRP